MRSFAHASVDCPAYAIRLSLTLSRQELLSFVKSAREAFDVWERTKKTDAARIYLACFHLWKR